MFIFLFRLFFFFSIILFALRKGVSFSRKITALFLFSVYSLAFLLSPYWLIFIQSDKRVFAVITLLFIGLFWSYHSSGSFKIKRKIPYLLLIVLIPVIIINLPPLSADIAYRGDEDYHLTRLMGLTGYFEQFKTGSLNLKLLSGEKLFRYPYLANWFSFFLSYPNLYVHTSLIRILPFFSLFLWLYYVTARLHGLKINPAVIFISVFLIASLPLVFFYSSLLYLELPAVFLITVVLFNLPILINSPVNQLVKTPSWYALLISGFIKETVLPVTVALIILRLVKIIFSGPLLSREAKIIFFLMLPYFIFLFFHISSGFAASRYTLNLTALLTPENYLILANSFFSQFGFFLILAVSGAVVLFIKDRRLFLSYFLVALIIFLFFLSYSEKYLGYSRWNLYLLPVFIVFFIRLISLIPVKFSLLLLSLSVTSNLLLSPVNPDGSRRPNWGSPLIDTAEYSYPYQKALISLKDSNISSVILAGIYYPYDGFSYYFRNLDYHPYMKYEFFPGLASPEEEESVFTGFLSAYASGASSLPQNAAILYHSQKNLNVDNSLLNNAGLVVDKKIRNIEHSLYILKSNK